MPSRLDVHRVHPPQARRLAGPPPVTRGRCLLPPLGTGQSVRVEPSPAADAGGPRRNLLLEPFHAAHPQRTGRPSSVTCTAATNGVLPSAPRPVCLLGFRPPGRKSRPLSSRSFITCISLCFSDQAVLADSQSSPRDRSSTGSADTWRVLSGSLVFAKISET